MEMSQASEARLDLAVTGMSCAGCAANVERALRKVDGVREAGVNIATAKATVLYDPGVVAPADLVKAIVAAGYGVAAAPDPAATAGEREFRELRISVLWGG